jgi:hypothetical protein
MLATDRNKLKFEWNMKVIAKGEDGRLMPEDDFYLHMVTTFSGPPDFIPEFAEATVPPGECR